MLLQLAFATLGLACYLVSNALVVSPAACVDAATRRTIYWLAFVRWSCWNTTFLLTTIKVCHTEPGPCLLKRSLLGKVFKALKGSHIYLDLQLDFDLDRFTELSTLLRCLHC